MTTVDRPKARRKTAAEKRATERQLEQEMAEAKRAADETLWERRMQALSLRNAGMVYSDIAKAQGTHPDTARTDVEVAKREVMTHSLEDIIATQRSVILDLRRASYPAALNGRDPDAQMKAHGSIYKGLEQEAKLVGAYAPMRTIGAPTDTEFGERFLYLVSLIKPDTLKELTRGYLSANPGAGDTAGHEPVDAEVIELNAAIPTPVAGGDDGHLGGVDPGGAHGAGQSAAPARDADDDDWANT